MASTTFDCPFIVHFLFPIIVGALWGCSNPLMGVGSRGISELPKKSNHFLQFLSEMKFLLTRWQFILPWLINLSGSILFYFSLSRAEISLVVPLTNSLTFVFTAWTSYLLGEQKPNAEIYFGVLLILIGISLCITSKA